MSPKKRAGEAASWKYPLSILKWIVLLLALNMAAYAAIVPVLFFQSPFSASDYEQNARSSSLEEISIGYEGGVLYGWMTRGDPTTVILYFGGDSADSSQWMNMLTSQHPGTLEAEATVVAVDYPTFGKSSGTISESSFYETAKLVYRYAKERFPDAGIIPMGYSIGSAAALRVAAENNCAGLILVAPMYDATSLYLRRGGLLHAAFEPFASVKMQNDEDANRCALKPLVIASLTDRVTKISDVRALCGLFPIAPEMFVLDECAHGKFWEHDEVFTSAADYIRRISAGDLS